MEVFSRRCEFDGRAFDGEEDFRSLRCGEDTQYVFPVIPGYPDTFVQDDWFFSVLRFGSGNGFAW
jgi:hypothetical protein